MKIVFTFSYKTYFKDNTKNYVTNYYVLIFLISVIFIFFSYNIGRMEYSTIFHTHIFQDAKFKPSRDSCKMIIIVPFFLSSGH